MAQQTHGAHMGGPRGAAGMMPGEKAKNFKGTMAKLLRYLSRYLPAIITVLVCAAASTVFSIFGPKVLGQATTKLFEGVMAMLTGTGGIDFTAIGQILLFLLAIYLASALLSYVQGWVMAGVATKVSYSMRREISEKIDRMPLSYFDRVPNGEVLSRITNDVDTVTQTLNQSLSQIVTNVTMMVGVLCMMLSISPLMTLVAICILPVSVLIVMNVVKRSQPYFRQQQDYLGHVNGHVEEMYGGHVVVTAFGREEESLGTFEKMNAKLYDAAWKSQFLSGMMMPLMNFAGNLGYVGICVLGGFLSLNGSITVGDIQAFIQYVRNFTQPINQIANISNVLQQTAAAAERVFAFLEEAEEPEAPKAPAAAAGLWGRIKQWYRNKGYLLAWILVAWGGVRLLREIADTVNFFAELLEFNDPTPEFWKANLMSAFVPDAIPPVLMSATGVVLALWGRRMEGRLRWYHLGWLPMLLGLVGTGFALPWPLRFGNGLVWWISAALLAVSPENAGKFLLSGLWINLVCLLISGLGLAILLLGRRYDRRSPSGKTE